MMKILAYALALATIPLLACSTKKGALSDESRTALQILADGPEFQTEVKYHRTAAILCQMCQEVQQKSDAEAAVFMQEFEYRNREALLQLGQETNDWQKSLTEEERVFFVMKVASEPYSTKLLACDHQMRDRPAIEPLYRQLVAAVEIRR